MQVTVGDAALTQSIKALEYFSAEYSHLDASLDCGNKVYLIQPFLYPYNILTLTGTPGVTDTLTLHSTDLLDVTAPITTYLRAHLEDFPTIEINSLNFDIEVEHPCEYTILNLQDVDDMRNMIG